MVHRLRPDPRHRHAAAAQDPEGEEDHGRRDAGQDQGLERRNQKGKGQNSRGDLHEILVLQKGLHGSSNQKSNDQPCKGGWIAK